MRFQNSSGVLHHSYFGYLLLIQDEQGRQFCPHLGASSQDQPAQPIRGCLGHDPSDGKIPARTALRTPFPYIFSLMQSFLWKWANHFLHSRAGVC